MKLTEAAEKYAKLNWHENDWDIAKQSFEAGWRAHEEHTKELVEEVEKLRTENLGLKVREDQIGEAMGSKIQWAHSGPCQNNCTCSSARYREKG